MSDEPSERNPPRAGLPGDPFGAVPAAAETGDAARRREPVFPEVAAVPAGAATGAPEASTAVPEAVTAAPEASTAVPGDATAAPEATAASPEVSAASPEATAASPEAVAATAPPLAALPAAVQPVPATPTVDPFGMPGAARPSPVPPVAPRRGPGRNILLFALTLLTTSYWGFLQYQYFYLEEIQEVTLNPFAALHLAIAGIPYGLAIIAFLLSHEMGHYLACRYYGIPATLPYFIPIPPIPPFVLLPGTMGAVIRILGPIKSRRALFDIAIAGPLAGFIVALPILAVGLTQSRVVDRADMGPSIEMGEPLIWGPLAAIFAPPIGVDQTLLAHPLAFVGWFALLVTAMNLLPVGQLDGGHLLYAVLPRHHRKVSLAVVFLMVLAGLRYFTGWIVFSLIVLFVLGTRHPRPLIFEQNLGAGRAMLLLLALIIFATSFMLVPVTIDMAGL